MNKTLKDRFKRAKRTGRKKYKPIVVVWGGGWLMKCAVHKLESLSSDPQHPCQGPGMILTPIIPGIGGEAEMGGSLVLADQAF